MKKLTVIIPVYNTQKYIESCIDSVIDYNGDDIEIIIVNDGTKDKSIDLIKNKYHDQRIKIINKENKGLASARNTGIDYAQGEYILHLDSDDYLHKGAIKQILFAINKYKSDVIIFDLCLVSSRGDILKVWKDGNLDEGIIYTSTDYLSDFFVNKCCPSCCNKVFKLSLYNNFNIRHPENISYGEDGSTTPRLISEAKSIIKINKHLYYYVQHDNSMMKNDNIEKKARDYNIAFEIVDNYLKNKNHEFYDKYRVGYKFWYVYSIIKNYTLNELKQKPYSSTLYFEYLRFTEKERANLGQCLKVRKVKKKVFYIAFATGINRALGENLKRILLYPFKLKKHMKSK